MPEISGIWVFVLGTATGVIGMGIAFLSYVLRHRAQKTKLTVDVTCRRELSDNVLEVLAIEVRMVNHSHFHVTIARIGLRVRDRWFKRRKHYAIEPYSLQDRVELPFRLDARDEDTVKIPIRKIGWFSDGRVPTRETAIKATDVYVETSTENRFYGRGDGLKSFLDEVRNGDLTKLGHWGQ